MIMQGTMPAIFFEFGKLKVVLTKININCSTIQKQSGNRSPCIGRDS